MEIQTVSDLDEQWLSYWEDKLKSSSGNLESNTGTIFRVQAPTRATDPIAYEPKFISIGPYHRNNPQLKAAEQLKLLYFKRTLARNPQLRLEHYLEHVNTLASESRSCYSGEINMTDREFADVLLIDGCFIIELLRLAKEMSGATDPILGCMPTRTLVEYDMLLIENQLPFFVLESLWKLVGGSDVEDSISVVDLAVDFFHAGQYLRQEFKDPLAAATENQYVPPEFKDPLAAATKKIYHILHLYHSWIPCEHLVGEPKKETGSAVGSQFRFSISNLLAPGGLIYKLLFLDTTALSDAEVMPVIPSITDLENSGMRVKKKKGNLWSVSFNHKIMEISPVQLHSYSNSFFRNMIAFEQHCFFSSEVKSKVTAYVMLMACLIESEKDLALLQQKNIVGYTLESKQEATKFFKKMCADAVVNYNKVYLDNLMDMTKKVRRIYDAEWSQFRASFKTLYFSNPETTMNLIYGVLLVSLFTGIQTVFHVLSYFKHDK